MFRTQAFATVARALRIAHFCNHRRVRTAAGMEMLAEMAEGSSRGEGINRREFLKRAGSAALAAGAGSFIITESVLARPPRRTMPRIAIIGGGLAGLACADRLRSRGYSATVYEAHPSRLGGRCFSLRNFFPSQVAENGGEFIDTLHLTMRSYAQQFKLAREDVSKQPGEIFYHFNGQRYTEAEVVDEYRVLVERMRPDWLASSRSPTHFAHNQADVALDNTDLGTFLATRGEGLPLVQKALAEAYVAEYGLEPHQQSCLNLLLFLHLDRRRKFMPFGVFSDERFHLVGGNDAIVQGIAQRLTGPIELRMKLERLSMNSLGEYELKFQGQGQVRKADAVVLTIPFSVLREVDLDATLNLSPQKLHAINTLGYGTNAKTMIGFVGRPWLTLHQSSGSAYSDLPNVQTTWETNPQKATAAHAILTDYAGGERGATLNSQTLTEQVFHFLNDLNVVYPGAKNFAMQLPGGYVAHREHWPSNPLVKGGYTCYTPGQFTTIAGLEGQPAGRLKFAGEHADSFYEWQGFMEGACNSGIRAANEILADIRAGVVG